MNNIGGEYYIILKLTGLEIMQIIDCGQNFAHASTISLTMEAFVLNRSSLVIPNNKGNIQQSMHNNEDDCNEYYALHRIDTCNTL